MSFGFSIGDILALAKLTDTLIRQVRHGPEQFRELEGDLELTRTFLEHLQNSWSRFSQHARAVGITIDDNETLRDTVTGIQSSLEQFQTELNKYNVGPAFARTVDNIQFSRQLQDLKQRLAFHMSSLQYAVQQLNVAQGDTIFQALQMIQEGQREQKWEDERRRGRQSRNPGRRLRPPESINPDDLSSTVSSREFLIERWRREVPSGLDSIFEQESLFVDTNPPNPAPLFEALPTPPPSRFPHVKQGKSYLQEVSSKNPSPEHQLTYAPHLATSETATPSNKLFDDGATTLQAPSEPGLIESAEELLETNPLLAAAILTFGHVILFAIVSLALSGYLLGKEAAGSWNAPHSNSLPTLIISCLELPIWLVAVLTRPNHARLRLISTAAAVLIMWMAALGSGIWLIHDTRTNYKESCNDANAGRDCGQATKMRFAIGSMQILIDETKVIKH